MRREDANVAAVDAVAAALLPLLDELVLVGGCAMSFVLTDPLAPEVRTTVDVDFVVELRHRMNMRRMEEELERCGAVPDLSESAPICRWRISGRIVDIMPSREELLGFSNRWYVSVLEESWHANLPSGRIIRVASAPSLLATKLEAFRSRGSDDARLSRDMEDIIALVDGRGELTAEISELANQPLKAFIQSEVSKLLARTDLEDIVSAHLLPDPGNQARLPKLLARLRSLGE